MTKLDLVKNGGKGSDNFQTPPWPIISLTDVIGEQLVEKTIYDPCMGEGQILKCLTDQHFLAIGTDVEQGVNFLKDELPDFDVILTNPPYSKKDQFIERCYETGKPFALLMPLTALEGQKRIPMYREKGMQLGILPARVNFKPPTEGKKSSAWFATAWFTHGFNLPSDITYLNKGEENGQ